MVVSSLSNAREENIIVSAKFSEEETCETGRRDSGAKGHRGQRWDALQEYRPSLQRK